MLTTECLFFFLLSPLRSKVYVSPSSILNARFHLPVSHIFPILVWWHPRGLGSCQHIARPVQVLTIGLFVCDYLVAFKSFVEKYSLIIVFLNNLTHEEQNIHFMSWLDKMAGLLEVLY